MRVVQYVQEEFHRFYGSQRHRKITTPASDSVVLDSAATEMIGEAENVRLTGNGSHWRQTATGSECGGTGGGEATEMQSDGGSRGNAG